MVRRRGATDGGVVGPDSPRKPGVSTGAYLPALIRHSATRLSRLGDPATNARLVGHQVQRLWGFWVVYNAMGGIEPMIESGLWPKSTAYKQLGEFRGFFHCEPYELEPELVEILRRAAASWPEKYRSGVAPVVEEYRQQQAESSDSQ